MKPGERNRSDLYMSASLSGAKNSPPAVIEVTFADRAELS
jgi:hypothetical protein